MKYIFRTSLFLLTIAILLCCMLSQALAVSQYTVIYDANGGSNAPANQVQNTNAALTLSSEKPTRSGYIFQGWATSIYGEPAYQPGDSYTSGQDITLYAVWTKSCSSCGGDGKINVTCSTCSGDGYYYKKYSTCCDYSVSETVGAYGTMFYQCQYCWNVCKIRSREISCSKTMPATCTACDGRGWDRASQPTAPTPELSAVTETSITVTALPNGIYSIDRGATWQHSNTFTHLTPGAAYTIVQCYVGGPYYNPGPASAELYVTTKKYAQQAPAAPTLLYAESTHVKLDSVDGCEYSVDGVTWQRSTTFYNLQPDTTYTFYQRKYNTFTHDASPSSPGLTVMTTGIGSLIVSQVTGSPGDTVTVDVILESSPHFTYLALYLDYDNAKLEFVELKKGVVFNSCNYRIYGSRIQAYLAEDLATANNTKTGVLFSVTFKILDSANIGTSAITPIVGSAHNIDVRDVEMNVSEGGVTISCGSHQFGNYVSNESTHWKVCSTCQFRTEMDDHEYDNDCDEFCNICQKERYVWHHFELRSNETGHWSVCTLCKHSTEVDGHFLSEEATENNPQTCLLCNYIIKPALSHKHEYDPELTADDSGHWHKCPGCEEKGNYAEHSFENACDPDCSECGYIRQADHDFSQELSANESHHYYTCSACGTKDSEVAHTLDENQTCTACGYQISSVQEEAQAEHADNASIPWWIFLIIGILAGSSSVSIFLLIKKKSSVS